MRFFGTFKNSLFRKNPAFGEKVGYKVGYLPHLLFIHFVNIVQYIFLYLFTLCIAFFVHIVYNKITVRETKEKEK